MAELDENVFLGLGDSDADTNEQDVRGETDKVFGDLKVDSTIYSVKLQGIVSYKVKAMDFASKLGRIVAEKSDTDTNFPSVVKLYDVDLNASSTVEKNVTYYASLKDAQTVLKIARSSYLTYMGDVLQQVQNDIETCKTVLNSSESYSDSEWVDAGMPVIIKRYGYPKTPVPNEIDKTITR